MGASKHKQPLAAQTKLLANDEKRTTTATSRTCDLDTHADTYTGLSMFPITALRGQLALVTVKFRHIVCYILASSSPDFAPEAFCLFVLHL
jgi:hypothetical protein